jgi:hypothetical protein
MQQPSGLQNRQLAAQPHLLGLLELSPTTSKTLNGVFVVVCQGHVAPADMPAHMLLEGHTHDSCTSQPLVCTAMLAVRPARLASMPVDLQPPPVVT